MACWHSGNKTRSSFGKRLQTGDTVKVELDIPGRSMTLYKNDECMGKAFNGSLPSGNTYYPAFSLYAKGDALRLLVGDSDAGESKVEAPAVSTTSAPAEVPAARKAQAEMLSAMGYDIEWCIMALENTRDNLEAAAEYLLTHGDELRTRAEAKKKEREDAERLAKQAAEESFFKNLAAQGGGRGGAGASKWVCGVCTFQNAAASAACEMCATARPTGAAAPAGAGGAGAGVTEGTASKWGVKMAIVPDYPPHVLAEVAARHTDRLSVLQEANRRWTMAMDSALISYVDSVCERNGKSPLQLSPEDVSPSPDELLRYPDLDAVTLQDMQLRFLVRTNSRCCVVCLRACILPSRVSFPPRCSATSTAA